MAEWTAREIDWESDAQPLRDFYNITWTGHPITQTRFFNWQFLDNYIGKPVGFIAEPIDRKDIVAGVYLVIRYNVLSKNSVNKFSTAMYTMTHPSYYQKGVFNGLAALTGEKCLETGIMGTVAVPNNNSLPGFIKKLDFNVLGQYDLVARPASPFRLRSKKIEVREISSVGELDDIKFDLDRRKTESGVVIGERNAKFITWRFFQCPFVSYKVFAAIGSDSSLVGLMVLRKVKRRGLPITVIVDFIVDHTMEDSGLIAGVLLARANSYALKKFTPLIMTSMNPSSAEMRLLVENGFRKMPKKILPHESNFIFRAFGNQPANLISDLANFENWYFSFADYDIF